MEKGIIIIGVTTEKGISSSVKLDGLNVWQLAHIIAEIEIIKQDLLNLVRNLRETKHGKNS